MAHIPDGLLSPPVIASAAALSAATLAVAARRTRDELADRQAPIVGAATAFVFAAQMFNFPLGAGTSAHLLGGVLLAVVVGPWAAMLALFSVLLVQALLFQDGGIAALGANTLNLAVIGAGGGYLVDRWLLALIGNGARRRLTAAGVAAFVSAMAIGLSVGLELGLSGLVPLPTALTVVGGAHLLVAGAEAGLTVGILAMVFRARPTLMRVPVITARARVVTALVTASALLALTAGAWASGRPDALEAAAATLGLHALRARAAAGGLAHVTPWLAVIGVIVVFALGWVVARTFAGRARAT